LPALPILGVRAPVCLPLTPDHISAGAGQALALETWSRSTWRFHELDNLKKQGEIQTIEWLDADGRPDFIVKWKGRQVILECKNVRSPDSKRKSKEPIRVELQKTRNSKDGTNTRAYRTDRFDILSVCLFNRTGDWSFLHIAARRLQPREGSSEFLKIMQEVPPQPHGAWRGTVFEALKDL
jgi:hypothetical protein